MGCTLNLRIFFPTTFNQTLKWHTPLSIPTRVALFWWLVSLLVSWCFEPSQQKIIYQGLKQTSIYLLAIQSTSHNTTNVFSQTITVKYFINKQTQPFIFHKTHQSLSKKLNYIHNFEMQTQKNSNTCFGAYLYSVGTQHGTCINCLWRQTGWPILFCGLTLELVLATANTEKIQERFLGKKCTWTDQKGRNYKGEISGSRCSMHGYIRTCSRL